MKLRSPRSSSVDWALLAAMLRIDTTNAPAVVDIEKLRDFYIAHKREILSRMREPTSPTRNVAAVVVTLVERKRSLRREAARAVDDAKRASEGQATLTRVMETYSGTPSDRSFETTLGLDQRSPE